MITTNNKYICPMHPEVVSDEPGRCSKCGMTLIRAGEKTSAVVARDSKDKGLGTITWQSYIPLGVIVFLIFTTALIASASSGQTESQINTFLLYIMTGFFLVFGGFKLMDLKGFAEGYSTYDLLAQKWFGYGYVYPFIELTFGFVMLWGFHPDWLLWTEFGIMTFGGIGVAIKIGRREPFMCACLGTFLKVPLTYVTLIEDFGMALLALLLIFLI